MERRRSLNQYRAVDLALWSLMFLVFESLIYTASTRWFPGQPYTVSLVPAITGIILIRWGAWAALPALGGGLLICLLSKAAPAQYFIYMAGNLCSLLLLPFLSGVRKKGVFASGTQVLGYAAALLAVMQAGRALAALAMGASLPVALGCFTTEAITDLFTLVLLWIVQRLDGILEDQSHYLRRVQQEQA